MEKDDEITLSPKHGLNPSLMQCPICHKDLGVALFGQLKNDEEAPKTCDLYLCDECKKEYITVLEAKDDKSITGRRCFIKREVLSEEYRNRDTVLMTVEDFQSLTLIS